MSRVVIGKTLSIRLSETEANNLKFYMKKHKVKKPSEALKQILNDELPKLEKEDLATQLEESPIPFSQKDLDEASKIAQILAIYPMRIFCPKDRQFYLTETLIEMCKECLPRIRKDCLVHRVPNV